MSRWLVTHPLLAGLVLWPLVAVVLVASVAALTAAGNPLEDEYAAFYFWATGITSALLTAVSYSRYPNPHWGDGIGLAVLSAGVAYGLAFVGLVFVWFGTDCFGQLPCPSYS